jgi:hypothetical protein
VTRHNEILVMLILILTLNVMLWLRPLIEANYSGV